MKPTFLRVGIPKSVTRAPQTVRPPTEASQASLPETSYTWDTQNDASGQDTSHTLTNLPEGVAGDLLVLMIKTFNSTSIDSLESGWNVLQGTLGSSSHFLVERPYDGTTGDDELVVTLDGSGNLAATGALLDAKGGDFSTKTRTSNAQAIPNGQLLDAPSVSPSDAPDTFIVLTGFMTNGTASGYADYTVPPDYTQLVEHKASGGLDYTGVWAWDVVDITTSEDPGDWDATDSGTRTAVPYTFAVTIGSGDPEVAASDHTHTLSADDITDIDVSTTAPVTGDLLEYDGTDWIPTLRDQYVATSSTTIANTVTETTLIGSGEGTLTFPANYFRAGRTVKLMLRGQVSDTGTPNLTLRVDLGGSTICSVGPTALTGVSSVEWQLDAAITCRTSGASGTFVGGGLFDYDDGTELSLGSGGGETTLDTTGTLTLDVTWEWGTADAANTITCQSAIIT